MFEFLHEFSEQLNQKVLQTSPGSHVKQKESCWWILSINSYLYLHSLLMWGDLWRQDKFTIHNFNCVDGWMDGWVDGWMESEWHLETWSIAEGKESNQRIFKLLSPLFQVGAWQPGWLESRTEQISRRHVQPMNVFPDDIFLPSYHHHRRHHHHHHHHYHHQYQVKTKISTGHGSSSVVITMKGCHHLNDDLKVICNDFLKFAKKIEFSFFMREWVGQPVSTFLLGRSWRFTRLVAREGQGNSVFLRGTTLMTQQDKAIRRHCTGMSSSP